MVWDTRRICSSNDVCIGLSATYRSRDLPNRIENDSLSDLTTPPNRIGTSDVLWEDLFLRANRLRPLVQTALSGRLAKKLHIRLLVRSILSRLGLLERPPVRMLRCSQIKAYVDTRDYIKSSSTKAILACNEEEEQMKARSRCRLLMPKLMPSA